jgi:hypothetical protein
MSEYQYYEFQAVDRPLDEREMQELRAHSSRATITPTRFVNHYDWGDFKGSPSAWMERYFDAFLYLANWGTHQLMLRLPQGALDLDAARAYCCGESASATVAGDFVVLAFESDDEADDDWDDGSGWLSSLIPLRADIAGGDQRALYLAWLLCAQNGELDDGAVEPPVPPGLGSLNASLQAFAGFLRIDGDLVAVAAERSPEVDAAAFRAALERWVAALPDGEKTEFLVRVAAGDEPQLRAELLRRFRGDRPVVGADDLPRRRTVAALMAAAERRAAVRHRREAEAAARERAQRERAEAALRDRYLTALAGREAETWRRVVALIATKQPGKYDAAVRLLVDLRDLGARDGRVAEVDARIRALYDQHARKPSLVGRLQKAGLVQSTA